MTSIGPQTVILKEYVLLEIEFRPLLLLNKMHLNRCKLRFIKQVMRVFF